MDFSRGEDAQLEEIPQSVYSLVLSTNYATALQGLTALRHLTMLTPFSPQSPIKLDASFEAIKEATQLHSLFLKDCNNTGVQTSLLFDALRSLNELYELSVSVGELEIVEEPCPELPELLHLSIQCFYHQPTVWNWIAQYTQLQSLDVRSSAGASRKFSAVKMVDILSKMPNLTSLSLCNQCDDNGSEMLASFIVGCTKLTNLVLAGIPVPLHNLSLHSLGFYIKGGDGKFDWQSCTSLSCLHVFTAQNMIPLPQLRQLKMEHMDNIGGLLVALPHMTALESLILLTEVSYEENAKLWPILGNLPELMRLKIQSEYTMITRFAKVVTPELAKMTKLTHLSLPPMIFDDEYDDYEDFIEEYGEDDEDDSTESKEKKPDPSVEVFSHLKQLQWLEWSWQSGSINGDLLLHYLGELPALIYVDLRHMKLNVYAKGHWELFHHFEYLLQHQPSRTAQNATLVSILQPSYYRVGTHPVFPGVPTDADWQIDLFDADVE